MNLSPRKEMVMNMFLVVIVKCMKLILYGLLTILLDDRARVGHAGEAGTYE